MIDRRGFLRTLLAAGAGAGLVAGTEAIGALDRPAVQRTLETHVAGAPYRIGFETRLDTVFHRGQSLRAVREPFNAYDEHAVALYAGTMHVGYLPRAENARAAAVLASGGRVDIEVLAVDADDPWRGTSIELRWE